jgi:hypothetical protein
MLIWKVIAANPGIDRAGLWAKVEHGIPEGYALRKYESQRNRLKSQADGSAGLLRAARRRVLYQFLWNMVDLGTLTVEGAGNDRHYTVGRQPRYKGNIDAVDETGTKAGEHMALVDAWHIIADLIARCDPQRPKANPKVSIKQAEALRTAQRGWQKGES